MSVFDRILLVTDKSAIFEGFFKNSSPKIYCSIKIYLADISHFGKLGTYSYCQLGRVIAAHFSLMKKENETYHT